MTTDLKLTYDPNRGLRAFERQEFSRVDTVNQICPNESQGGDHMNWYNFLTKVIGRGMPKDVFECTCVFLLM